MLQIKNLTCEYLTEPIGVISREPRLSWQLIGDENDYGKAQSAYQIIVSDARESLVNNEGNCWDSGKVASNKSIFVKYKGVSLKSRGLYFWKVKVWDEEDNESDWSELSTWTMGIYPAEWKGKWIGEVENVSYEERFPISTELAECSPWIKTAARREHPKGPGPENEHAAALYLRREFTVGDLIERAILRIAGLGYYEAYINGEKIGDHVLDPGATDYSKTVYYLNYDITKQLNTDRNCIGIMLGNGWYWVGTPDLFEFDKAEWAAPPRCSLEVEVIFKSGVKKYIYSDKDWICTSKGPIRFNCIRSGEVYNANFEVGEWSHVGYSIDESKWKNVKLVTAPKGILRPQLSPPIRIRDKFGPCKRVILNDGKIVYWFPKNNAGWFELSIKGNEGQKVKIELNEVLNADGSVDMEKHSGHTYGRYQTCEYICNGKGIETYRPSFCYAGFQYLQISGAEPDQIVSIVAHQVCTDLEEAGHFRCSDLLINAIDDAAKLTFLNSFHSYPEDCPQREKAGWTEDGLISAHGSIYNFNGFLAYEKWIQDLLDAQHECGQVPDIVPTPFWGKPEEVSDEIFIGAYPNRLTGRMADPWWGGTLVMLSWKIYEHYGDVTILERTYDSMKKYVDFLLKTTRLSENEYSYLIFWEGFLGEWLEVGAGGSANRTPKILTCTQAFYKCADVISKTARILNKLEDEKYYKELAENIKNAFNEEFLDEETGLYHEDSQSAQAMSVVLGLVPDGFESKVFDQLIHNVYTIRKGHLSTGIVGTYHLYKALGQFGRPDTVYDVLTAKGFPGFEHNLTRVNEFTPLPSTTIWEDWGGRSSLAHPVQGAVVAYFYEYLAGIQSVSEYPGFKKVIISPTFLESIEWVKCWLNTPYGRITSNWEKESESIILNIEIPVNSEGELILNVKKDDLLLDNEPITISTSIKHIRQNGEKLSLKVGSGKFQFKIKTI